MPHVASFFHALPDIAAMKTVEDIFHRQAEDDFNDEEVEQLEDLLAEDDYSYVGINSIVYLYKGDDIIADLDTDDYSWSYVGQDVDPLATVNAFINTIAKGLPH